MKSVNRYSIIATLAFSQLVLGCSSPQSRGSMGVFSDGVQGPMVTAPTVASNTLEDGSIHTQSLGVRTYSTRALELISLLKPVSFEFLDSGELYAFSIDGADPLVIAAGGQMILDTVTLNEHGKIVAWQASGSSISQNCQIVVTVITGPPHRTVYSCNTIDCTETCIPTWTQVGELFSFSCTCPATP